LEEFFNIKADLHLNIHEQIVTNTVI